MTQFVNAHKISLLGLIIGGILGYAYYHFIGCASGTCAITSKPVNSTIYGMVMGYLLFSIVEKSKKERKNV